ncbi:uncharacterized protein FOBCDRAFT_208708 [Fusarium oxysporum Fo47]|uniref:uncharacterized protein n=1 Tax=Fusarium oxysporum Fo47 TaxID=660027 RepID=UPI002869D7E9|nr:uncharacterized protein FOBCDRAFT_208708 [Fusarium oxysporum Fo47]WJG37179.1 hypothetical protein FOBCDRAFT_208708 [Fusarium oxysporum Fo47]
MWPGTWDTTCAIINLCLSTAPKAASVHSSNTPSSSITNHNTGYSHTVTPSPAPTRALSPASPPAPALPSAIASAPAPSRSPVTTVLECYSELNLIEDQEISRALPTGPLEKITSNAHYSPTVTWYGTWYSTWFILCAVLKYLVASAPDTARAPSPFAKTTSTITSTILSYQPSPLVGFITQPWSLESSQGAALASLNQLPQEYQAGKTTQANILLEIEKVNGLCKDISRPATVQTSQEEILAAVRALKPSAKD